MRPLFFISTLFIAIFGYSSTATVTENDPSSFVEGVSVITGNFYSYDEDYTVHGAEPIHLRRCYISGEGLHDLNLHLFAMFIDGFNLVRVREANGTPIMYAPAPQNLVAPYTVGDGFYGKFEQNKPTLRYNATDYALKEPGVSNTAKGKISAHTNLMNNYLLFEPTKDPKGKSFTLYAADGTIRRYEHVEDQEMTKDPYGNKIFIAFYYRLVRETLPNGHIIHYDWDYTQVPHPNPKSKKKFRKIPILTRVRTTDSTQTILFSQIDVSHQDLFSTVKGSDQRSLIYERKSLKNHFLLDTVHPPDLPTQSIHWTTAKPERFYIDSYTLPNQRKISIQYNPSDYRVQKLHAPVGKDARLLPIYTFSYQPQQKQSQVIDAQGNLTEYFWNDQYRLTHIQSYEGKTLKKIEKFAWDGILLQCKSLLDANQTPLSAVKYLYDSSGNVIEEIFYGNLSGSGSAPTLNSEGIPLDNGVERYSKKNTYTTDGKRLPQETKEAHGLTIKYTYLDQTHLLKTKQYYDHDILKITYTYDYDPAHILIRETIDDGQSTRIKEITPLQKFPFIGMPHIIRESYLENGKPTLLKKTILHYRTDGLVESKEIYDAHDQYCYTLTMQYDEKGKLLQETNPLGQTAFYAYDELGNCIYTKDFSGRLETKRKYDFSNRLVEQTECGEDGICHTSSFSYDLKHNLVEKTDPFGQITSYTYDAAGHVLSTTFPPLPDENGALQSPSTQNTYDSVGNAITTTDALGWITQTSYNSYQKPVEILYADGSRKSNRYFLDGSLASETDPLGLTTSYTYDYLGRLLKKEISASSQILSQETYVYAGFQLISKTDAEGCTTTYTYDGAGRKRSEEANGETLLYTYDALGRIESVQREDLWTLYTYDLLDRVLTEEQRAQSPTGQLLRKVDYEYDAAGNQASITHYIDEQPSQETFLYDSQNRCIQKTDALGNREITTYNDHFIDSRGQTVLQKIHTDALGLQTLETYNPHGKIASIEKRKETRLSLEEKFYTAKGDLSLHVHTVYAPDGSFRTIRTRWDYDCHSRLQKLTEAEGSVESKITTYTYFPDGKLQTITKPNGVVLSYRYDLLKNPQQIDSSDQTVHHQMLYNKRGELLETDGILRHLDLKGRILEEIYPQGFRIQTTYNRKGQKESLQIPQADCRIDYTYNPLDLKRIDRKTLSGNLLYSHNYLSYDLTGNLLEENLIGGRGSARYTYDLLSRPTQIRSSTFTQEILQYDPVGNIRKMQLQGIPCAYDYDALYQLTQEQGRFSHSYLYDSLYNRLQKDDELYQVNALQQIPSHFQYDPNGNPTFYGDTRYTYDALDRLIRLETPDLTKTYVYDSLHRRLTEQTFQAQKQTTRHYLYEGQNEIGSFDEELHLLDLRILGPTPHAEIRSAISIELGSQIYAPIHDLQGNLAQLIPLHQEEELSTYFYSAFGEETLTGPTLSPWRFSSKRSDPDTQLVYYGRRYYLPAMGRWLTPDPSGFTDGMNLYAFVHNDPLTHFDEYGLWTDNGPRSTPYWRRAIDDIGYNIDQFRTGFDQGIASSAFSMARMANNLSYAMPGSVNNRNFHRFFDETLNRYETRFNQSFFPGGNPDNWMFKAGHFIGATAADLAISSFLFGTKGAAYAKQGSAWVEKNVFSKFFNSKARQQATRQEFLETLERRILQTRDTIDVNALSKSGKFVDRNRLTIAGRALDKHGNRPGSPFSKGLGNQQARNLQGQHELDEILTHPDHEILYKKNGDFEIYAPDGRGAYFKKQGIFRGFIRKRERILNEE